MVFTFITGSGNPGNGKAEQMTYAIFETLGTRKFQVFNGDLFVSREAAIAAVPSVMDVEMDDENDAADIITKGGMVYAVERVA